MFRSTNTRKSSGLLIAIDTNTCVPIKASFQSCFSRKQNFVKKKISYKNLTYFLINTTNLTFSAARCTLLQFVSLYEAN